MHMTGQRGRVRSMSAFVVVGNKKGLAGNDISFSKKYILLFIKTFSVHYYAIIFMLECFSVNYVFLLLKENIMQLLILL